MSEDQKSPATTKMVAPEAKKTKMVQVKILREVNLEAGRMAMPGEVVTVSEAEAETLCKKFRAPMNFPGERILADHEKDFHIARATRMSAAS